MAQIKDSYRKVYRLVKAVKGRKSIKITFPYEFIEHEARKHNLSVDEFIERFQAIAQYDNYNDVHYTFEETDKEPVAPK